jgi:S-adenosylmethionine hydrolase
LVITLLTDFGTSSSYVGSMKGVILNISPDIRIVDMTHEIAPQDVEEAAFVLKQAYSHFPEGTIHVVVVDPGVGTDRAILAVRAGSHLFLAPDNGVLKYVFDANPECAVYRVANPEYFLDGVSRTFHGRDIFAPVAAHLSMGVPLEKIGKPFPDYDRGRVLKPRVEESRITGQIVYVDRFGNGITNIGADLIQGRRGLRVQVNLWNFDGVHATYAEVRRGEPLVLVGSDGTLEIAVHQGNAKEKMKFQLGDEVIVSFERDSKIDDR